MLIKEQNSKIRKLIKSQSPTCKVRASVGTSADWLDVFGSLKLGQLSEREKLGLVSLGLRVGRKASYGYQPIQLSYEDKELLLKKFGKWIK